MPQAARRAPPPTPGGAAELEPWWSRQGANEVSPAAGRVCERGWHSFVPVCALCVPRWWGIDFSLFLGCLHVTIIRSQALFWVREWSVSQSGLLREVKVTTLPRWLTVRWGWLLLCSGSSSLRHKKWEELLPARCSVMPSKVLAMKTCYLWGSKMGMYLPSKPSSSSPVDCNKNVFALNVYYSQGGGAWASTHTSWASCCPRFWLPILQLLPFGVPVCPCLWWVSPCP